MTEDCHTALVGTDEIAGDAARVLLVSKAGCHLCEDAERVVAEVCGELGVSWAIASVLEDPALADAYWELIPVTLVDGRLIARWGLEAQELRDALTVR